MQIVGLSFFRALIRAENDLQPKHNKIVAALVRLVWIRHRLECHHFPTLTPFQNATYPSMFLAIALASG